MRPGDERFDFLGESCGHLSGILVTRRLSLDGRDRLHVRGHTTDMTEILAIMKITHVSVTSADAGDPVVHTIGQCCAGDYPFKVE